jgi:hypothetical protein
MDEVAILQRLNSARDAVAALDNPPLQHVLEDILALIHETNERITELLVDDDDD